MGKGRFICLPMDFSPDSSCLFVCKMNPWLETFCVALVAIAGVCAGKKASGLPNPLWSYLLAIPALMLLLLMVSSTTNLLDKTGALCFITAGRAKFIILAFAITMGLTTPLSRLPYKIERIFVSVIMLIFVFAFAILPFLMPALIEDDLSKLESRFGEDGVCYQSKSYTCGPAAAVTALKKLGLTAQEGEIAVLARTNPVSGTLLWTLYSALKTRYRDQGIQCRFTTFDSIKQLRNAGITLVSMKESTLMDHCVAVLDVSETLVTIADPVTGMETISYQQFADKWHFCGIVISRSTAATF